MALLDEIKVSLRLSTDALDSEVASMVSAALYDLERVGIDPRLLVDEDDDFTEANPRARALVKSAVAAWCKEHFGYDNAEAARFGESYRRIAVDLAHSEFYRPFREGDRP